jgi:hypothetical protein
VSEKLHENDNLECSPLGEPKKLCVLQQISGLARPKGYKASIESGYSDMEFRRTFAFLKTKEW